LLYIDEKVFWKYRVGALIAILTIRKHLRRLPMGDKGKKDKDKRGQQKQSKKDKKSKTN